MGIGIENVFEAIITRLPSPNVNRESKFRGLLFDSWYDKYRGVLCLIYVHDGEIVVGNNIASCHTKKCYEVKTLSILRPQEENVNKLYGQNSAFTLFILNS